MRINYMKNRYNLHYFSKYSTLSKRIFLFRVYVCSYFYLIAKLFGVVCLMSLIWGMSVKSILQSYNF